MSEPHDPFSVVPFEGIDGREALRRAREEFGQADRQQWVIERQHFEEGRTLSSDAVERTVGHIGRFVVVRLNDIWDQTGKPPQRLVVNVQVPGTDETLDDLLRIRDQLRGALADVDLRLAAHRRDSR